MNSEGLGLGLSPAVGVSLVVLMSLGGMVLGWASLRCLVHRGLPDDGATVAERSRLQAVGQEVERARGERSRLLTALAHDMRQPLYAISLALQGLEQRKRIVLSPVGGLLTQLHDALEAADALLDTINTVALLDSGALQPRPSVFCVQGLLERIDRLHGPRARAMGLRWTVTPSLDHACTDAALLERMLDNLVSNALRCTERGGVLVACRRRQAHLLVQVWDTGPGFDSLEPQAVFGLHFRGEALSDTDNGVGLGLPIVQRAAQLLGIEVSVRSRVGRGTCFSLQVPLGPAALSPPA